MNNRYSPSPRYFGEKGSGVEGTHYKLEAPASESGFSAGRNANAFRDTLDNSGFDDSSIVNCRESDNGQLS